MGYRRSVEADSLWEFQALNREIVFLTYCDGKYCANANRNAWYPRVFWGARTVTVTRGELERDSVYAAHREVFDQPTGAGCWAWKPWAILRTLRTLSRHQVLVYQDCGFGLRYRNFIYPRELIGRAIQGGFIAGVQTYDYGVNAKWNSRTCIETIGSYDQKYLDAPLVEAVFSFWTNTVESCAFLEEWQALCLRPEVIGITAEDKLRKQDGRFVGHRFDQSILTNLVIRENAPVVEFSGGNPGLSKSIGIVELAMRRSSSLAAGAAYSLLVSMAMLRKEIYLRKSRVCK